MKNMVEMNDTELDMVNGGTPGQTAEITEFLKSKFGWDGSGSIQDEVNRILGTAYTYTPEDLWDNFVCTSGETSCTHWVNYYTHYKVMGELKNKYYEYGKYGTSGTYTF